MPTKKVWNLKPGDFRNEQEKAAPLMTPTEAARKLGVSASVVRGWVDKGLLRPLVVAENGQYHFTEQQIFRYRYDSEVRAFLREVDQIEFCRYMPGRELEPVKRPRLKEPVPDFMPPSLAAHLLCVSIATLKLWRRRKAFPPLIILPTGQARYSEFQIMTFSPEAVQRVARSKLRETAPGREKRIRKLNATFDEIWHSYPYMQELYPRTGSRDPMFSK
jgi:DNA-binding transcriptional MerR regulator